MTVATEAVTETPADTAVADTATGASDVVDTIETTLSPIPMYTESPSPDAELSDTTDADVTETDATDEAPDESQNAAPDTATDPDESRNADPQWSKPLQKLQQKQSAFEKQVADKLDAITKLVQRPTLAAAETSAQQAEQAAETQGALDDLTSLIEGKEDDLVDASTVRKAFTAFQARIDALSKRPTAADPKVAELEKQLGELLEAQTQAQQTQQMESAARDWFTAESKQHGIDAEQVWSDSVAEALKLDPELASQPQLHQGAARAIYRQKVTQPKPATPVKPAGDQPRTPTKGADTVGGGATTAKTSTTTKPAKPRMYVEDPTDAL